MITVLHRGGYAQMITILHGGGSLRTPKSDYVICARPLSDIKIVLNMSWIVVVYFVSCEQSIENFSNVNLDLFVFC